MISGWRKAALDQSAVALLSLLALGLVFNALHRLSDPGGYAVETIALGLAAGVIYFLALYALEHTADRRLVFWLILGGALLFRLELLTLSPTLSDDLLRYRWDGRIQQAGWNPYAVRPDDPRLVPLRDPRWVSLPGRDIPSIYPPLAEIIFRGTYALARHVSGPASLLLFKLPAVAADLLLVVLLACWLRASGARHFQLAIYAWNPLVIVEYAVNGHIDAVAVAAATAACFLIIRGRTTLSTLLLTAGALVKLFPLVLLPWWLRRAGWPLRLRGWLAGLAAMTLAAMLAGPYLYHGAPGHHSAWPPWAAVGPQILDSLAYYQSHWHNNNASLAALLGWLTGCWEVVRGIGIGVVAALALWVALTAPVAEPGKSKGSAESHAALLLFGAILLLSPNAFSWYFTWVVPALCLLPSWRFTLPWLLLTVLQFLSYHVLIDYRASGVWHFQPGFLWPTYGPFYALALWRSLRPDSTAER